MNSNPESLSTELAQSATPPAAALKSSISAEEAALEAKVVAMFAADHTNTEGVCRQAETEFLDSNHVVTTNVSEVELAARFSNTTMSQTPTDAESYMGEIVNSVVKDSVHCGNSRMIGHMTSALPNFARPLARLTTCMNQNAVKTETAKTVTFLEREAIAMLHRQLYKRDDAFYEAEVQNPSRTMGLFTSGGTLANVSALWIARNKRLGKDGENFAGVSKEGIMKAMMHYGYSDAVIIGSALMHYSMNKSVDVLGLGENSLVKIPVNERFQVDIVAMEAAIKEFQAKNVLVIAMIGIAGATETGSVDPLQEMAALAKKYDIHFHVDAAWGGPLIFSEKHSPKVAGIEEADTVTLDGHKQLYMPMGCGLCFVKEPSSVDAIKKTANYIIRDKSYDLGKFTLEGSRPANAMFLHSNLNILGVAGYGVLVDRSIRLVEYMADWCRKHDLFELILEPMSNILLYRHVPQKFVGRMDSLTAEEIEEIDETNRQLQTMQKNVGKTFVSRTTIFAPRYKRMTVALRVVIANPLTNDADIDCVLNDQLALLPALAAQMAVTPVAAN